MGRVAELAMEMDNVHSLMGHNGPPEPTPFERAEEAQSALDKFLNATPVITGHDLVEAKRLVEHARGAMAELEDERVALVDPLNKQLASINGKYKAVHNTDAKKPGTFDKVLNELKSRLTSYAREEERKRQEEADRAIQLAATAEAAARAAEAAEQEAKRDAVVGVVDTGVAEKIAAADQAFTEFEAASRFAARAERETTFRIGGGEKALSMRTEKTLVLESYSKAIKAIGKNEKIEAAILSAARDYRKENGTLPDGVVEYTARKF